MEDRLAELLDRLVGQVKEGLLKQGADIELLKSKAAECDIQFATMKAKNNDVADWKSRVDAQQMDLFSVRKDLESAISEIRATIRTGVWFVGIAVGILGVSVAVIALLK